MKPVHVIGVPLDLGGNRLTLGLGEKYVSK